MWALVKISFVFLLTISEIYPSRCDPVVFVTLLASNKAYALPYFLKLFEELDYPKENLILWIRSDRSHDDSEEILRTWVASATNLYRKIYYESHASTEMSEFLLKEEALNEARQIESDFFWFLDCDVFLINNETMNVLRALNKAEMLDATIVAPMISTWASSSNFWTGNLMDYAKGDLNKDETQKLIETREVKGCHQVSMVHSCFWIDLRHPNSRKLTFMQTPYYDGSIDSKTSLAFSAANHGIKIYLCNSEPYGFMMASPKEDPTSEDYLDELLNVKQAASDFMLIEPHTLLEKYVTYPPKSKLNFDEIFVINLERRPEQRRRMEWALHQFGIDFRLFSAIDGRSLNASYLHKLGVRFLSDFLEAQSPGAVNWEIFGATGQQWKRDMNLGEIGCFLSHYFIWKEIIESGAHNSLVLEDDVYFKPNFRRDLISMMNEVKNNDFIYDLIWIGRVNVLHEHEAVLPGFSFIINAGLSYATFGYVISLKGAKKLVAGKPLDRMIQIDHFISNLRGRYPHTVLYTVYGELIWEHAFPNRNLQVYATRNDLVYHNDRFDQPHYSSDTLAEMSLNLPRNLDLDIHVNEDLENDEFASQKPENNENAGDSRHFDL